MTLHMSRADIEDALREVANIMVSHAATALARLSATRFDVEIPSIRVLDWEDAVVAASGGERLIAGVRTRMLGRLNGEIYVSFPRQSALALSDLLRGIPPGSTQYMSASAATTLVEVGNVVAGSCLAAFYQFLDVSLVHSVPEFMYDAPESLLSRASEVAADARNVLLAQVNFAAPDVDIRGHIVLLFSLESMPDLLAALERKV